jgi:hypothetical protein
VSGREVVQLGGRVIEKGQFGTGSQSLVLYVECAVWKGGEKIYLNDAKVCIAPERKKTHEEREQKERADK